MAVVAAVAAARTSSRRMSPRTTYSTVQYSTVTVLYSTVQYSTVPSRDPCRGTPGIRTPARGSSPCTMHMHMSDGGGS